MLLINTYVRLSVFISNKLFVIIHTNGVQSTIIYIVVFISVYSCLSVKCDLTMYPLFESFERRAKYFRGKIYVYTSLRPLIKTPSCTVYKYMYVLLVESAPNDVTTRAYKLVTVSLVVHTIIMVVITYSLRYV